MTGCGVGALYVMHLIWLPTQSLMPNVNRLEQLLYLLCDEGDGVMVRVPYPPPLSHGQRLKWFQIATPYYAGFPKEIKARNNAVPIDVQLGDLDPTCPETIGAFEEAYDKASSAGGPRAQGGHSMQPS